MGHRIRGQLHELGKLILLVNLSKDYLALEWQAQNQSTPLIELEQRAFGTTHAKQCDRALDGSIGCKVQGGSGANA